MNASTHSSNPDNSGGSTATQTRPRRITTPKPPPPPAHLKPALRHVVGQLQWPTKPLPTPPTVTSPKMKRPHRVSKTTEWEVVDRDVTTMTGTNGDLYSFVLNISSRVASLSIPGMRQQQQQQQQQQYEQMELQQQLSFSVVSENESELALFSSGYTKSNSNGFLRGNFFRAASKPKLKHQNKYQSQQTTQSENRQITVDLRNTTVQDTGTSTSTGSSSTSTTPRNTNNNKNTTPRSNKASPKSPSALSSPYLSTTGPKEVTVGEGASNTSPTVKPPIPTFVAESTASATTPRIQYSRRYQQQHMSDASATQSPRENVQTQPLRAANNKGAIQLGVKLPPVPTLAQKTVTSPTTTDNNSALLSEVNAMAQIPLVQLPCSANQVVRDIRRVTSELAEDCSSDVCHTPGSSERSDESLFEEYDDDEGELPEERELINKQYKRPEGYAAFEQMMLHEQSHMYVCELSERIFTSTKETPQSKAILFNALFALLHRNRITKAIFEALSTSSPSLHTSADGTMRRRTEAELEFIEKASKLQSYRYLMDKLSAMINASTNEKASSGKKNKLVLHNISALEAVTATTALARFLSRQLLCFPIPKGLSDDHYLYVVLSEALRLELATPGLTRKDYVAICEQYGPVRVPLQYLKNKVRAATAIFGGNQSTDEPNRRHRRQSIAKHEFQAHIESLKTELQRYVAMAADKTGADCIEEDDIPEVSEKQMRKDTSRDDILINNDKLYRNSSLEAPYSQLVKDILRDCGVTQLTQAQHLARIALSLAGRTISGGDAFEAVNYIFNSTNPGCTPIAILADNQNALPIKIFTSRGSLRIVGTTSYKILSMEHLDATPTPDSVWVYVKATACRELLQQPFASIVLEPYTNGLLSSDSINTLRHVLCYNELPPQLEQLPLLSQC